MTAPYDHPLNLTMQAILTYGSWALTLVFLVLALRMSAKERTPFYVLIILAAMVGAFAEPLYDEGLMLLFYVPGIWTHFSAFNIPQPLWTHSGYVVLYASAAIYICQQIHAGTLTKKALYGWALIELAMSCTFEMIGINGGAYEYWGPHVFRIFNYPLVIGVLEAAQVICFSVAAAELRKRVSGPMGLLGLFLVFPCTFYLANFGAGSFVIIALHLDQPSTLLVTIATLLSLGSALLLIRAAASFLPDEATALAKTRATGELGATVNG
ncbi:hypothetical protein AB4876_17295 [Zhongshania guokunii]|uniref:Uncharacterized protein n=1 Tax=Zhongshania guokunii TaxID=641783 RepID=A0ABV3UAX4_9GAMM